MKQKKTIQQLLAEKVCRPRFHTRPKSVRLASRIHGALNRGPVRGESLWQMKLNLEYQWARNLSRKAAIK